MNNLLSETIQIALVLGFMGFLAWFPCSWVSASAPPTASP